jgi:hypothetical protein
VLHPKQGWEQVRGDALGGDLAAAVLSVRGRWAGRISVLAGPAAPPPGAQVHHRERFTQDGRAVVRTEYSHRAPGSNLLLRGVDVASPGGAGREAVLVRIRGADGWVSPVALRQIANSVTLG